MRSFTSFRMTDIKKPCAEKRMADLAPCVGITRIRFKGSSEFLRTSQPLGSPAIEKRIEIARLKSTIARTLVPLETEAMARPAVAPYLLIADGDNDGRRGRICRWRGSIVRRQLAEDHLSIISKHERALFIFGEIAIILDADADRLRKLFSPVLVCDQPAFAAFGEKAALDQNSGNFR